MTKKRDAAAKDLLANGWIEFMPENEFGWRFFFRRNNEPPHPYFGPGYDYKTLYPCGDTADGIVETPYQRWVRQKHEILFRNFRGAI